MRRRRQNALRAEHGFAAFVPRGVATGAGDLKKESRAAPILKNDTFAKYIWSYHVCLVISGCNLTKIGGA